VWRAVLDELGQVLTVENVNAWLATNRALDQDGEAPRVAVPAPFNQEWLVQKLAGMVTGALHKIDDTRDERSPLRRSRLRHDPSSPATRTLPRNRRYMRVK